MTAKSNIVLEVTINERTYSLSIPLGAPHGEAYDATISLLRDLVELSKQAINQIERKDKDKEEGGV